VAVVFDGRKLCPWLFASVACVSRLFAALSFGPFGSLEINIAIQKNAQKISRGKINETHASLTRKQIERENEKPQNNRYA
jgi:hypothetical protein